MFSMDENLTASSPMLSFGITGTDMYSLTGTGGWFTVEAQTIMFLISQ